MPAEIFWIAATILGLAIGSFTTCIVYRIPRGISIWRRPSGDGEYRSHCPQCLKPLTVRDLIPIISWVLARGRCRQCGQPIGWHYPVIEAAVLAATLVAAAMLGFSIKLAVFVAIIPVFAGSLAYFLGRGRS